MEWSNEEGHKLLQRAEDTLRIVEAGAPGQESQVAQSVGPSEGCPLKVGWDVVYRGQKGRLESGIIQTVQSASRGWRLHLDNGHTISSSVILSVGRRENGTLVAFWNVRTHGLDGTREQPCPPPKTTHLNKMPQSSDWLTAWRELAELTSDIPETDSRFPHVMQALDSCDHAYAQGHWGAFQEAVQNVRRALQG
jgi:hypothetical protein